MSQVNPQTILEDEGLFAAADGFVAPLSADELLFQSAGLGDVHVMTDQVLRALDLCRPFRTIAEHVRVIMAAIPALAERQDAVAVVLKNLADRGLLLRASDYLSKLSESDDAALGEQTADAQDQSPLLVFVRGGQDLQLDSGYNVCRTDNANLQAAVGAAACESFPESADTIRWLLGVEQSPGGAQFAAGQQRNLASLVGAGQVMAVLDDDLDLTARRMGVRDPGLTLAAASRPKLDFQATYELAAEAGQALDRDALAAMAEPCGNSIATLMSLPMAAGIGPQSLAGQDLRTLGQFSAQSRIMTVTCGVYGSDRRPQPLWPWVLPTGAREQFAGDEEDYTHNRDAGYVWRTLSDQRLGALEDQSPWLVDGRSLLPPVLPTGRWEAGLFNALMRYLYPQDSCLELAFAIGHRNGPRPLRPTPEGNAPGDDWAQARVPEAARFLADFADSRDNLSHAQAPADRMDFLGGRMLDLAAADHTTLTYKLREYVTWFRATLIRSLQETMVGWQQAPTSWQEDIRSVIEANGRSLANGDAPILAYADDAVPSSEIEQVQRLREMLQRFGEALVVWPHLWELARQEGQQWQQQGTH